MQINNYPSSIPSTVRGVFDSYVPFGSDFVYYCVDNSYGSNTVYSCVYRPVGRSTLVRVTATRDSSGHYVFSQTETDTTYDGFTVTYPEFCYSNCTGCGIYYDPPSGSGLIVVCVVVLASLSILRTVFGGIKWVRSRKYRV